MKAWNVCLNGKIIDTVFYDDDSDAEEVRRSLIDHDGYDPEITVRDDLPRCPHCNDDVYSLGAFVLEENKYSVSLSKEGSTPQILVWTTSEVIESSEVRTVYRCGNCENTLFMVMASDDPQIVIDFLKGVRMIYVRDVSLFNYAEVVKTLNEENTAQGPVYYGLGFPREGGDFGVYYVDGDLPTKGMEPYAP